MHIFRLITIFFQKFVSKIDLASLILRHLTRLKLINFHDCVK
jgi:hypothetical protein